MKSLFHISLLALLLAACSPHARHDSHRPTVAVSIEPQHYLLQRIVGDSIRIVTMLPPDADPENYEPSIRLLKELNDSRLYFSVGNMPFEEQLLSRSGIRDNGSVKVLSAASLQNITDTHAHEHENHSPHHDGADPHIWTSPANCLIMAQQMLSAVTQLDPDKAAYYTARFNLLKHELDSLNSLFASRLAPCAGDMIIVEHPSLSYFARDYGISQLYFGAENKEITPTRLRAVIDSARSLRRAVTMVSEATYNAARTRAIARQAGATSIEINTLGSDFLQQLSKLSIQLADSHNAHSQSAR